VWKTSHGQKFYSEIVPKTCGGAFAPGKKFENTQTNAHEMIQGRNAELSAVLSECVATALQGNQSCIYRCSSNFIHTLYSKFAVLILELLVHYPVLVVRFQLPP
jgi:hypothetical protein